MLRELHCHGFEYLLELHCISEFPWDPDSKVLTVSLEQVENGNLTQLPLFWHCSESAWSNKWIHCPGGEEERIVGCHLPTLLLYPPLHSALSDSSTEVFYVLGWIWTFLPEHIAPLWCHKITTVQAQASLHWDKQEWRQGQRVSLRVVSQTEFLQRSLLLVAGVWYFELGGTKN